MYHVRVPQSAPTKDVIHRSLLHSRTTLKGDVVAQFIVRVIEDVIVLV